MVDERGRLLGRSDEEGVARLEAERWPSRIEIQLEGYENRHWPGGDFEQDFEGLRWVELQREDPPKDSGADGEILRNEAREAAHAFLTRRAEQASSGEGFTFESLSEEGSEIILKYRASHPDWFIRTHEVVTVAYDPRTKAVRFVGR